MATIAEMREAAADTISAAIPELSPYARVADAMNLPAFVVQPAEADFNVAMGRGTDTWTFHVYVLCSLADGDLAQEQLDGYVAGAGPNSIRAAVFAKRNLGMLDSAGRPVLDAHVNAVIDYGVSFEVEGIANIGAVLSLVIHTKGTE